MLYTIKNDKLMVEIADKGAEIKRINFLGVERFYDSDPKYWNRSAPLLWPCIGAIKDKFATFDGVDYPLTKHGILRDIMFNVVSQKSDYIRLELHSNEETLKLYPFDFSFIVEYYLEDDTLYSTIKVKNLSNKIMPYNLGLHPAFKLPIYEGEKAEDYKFVFEKEQTFDIPTIDLVEGTIDYDKPYRHFDNLKELPFNYDDFDFDAIIFDHIESNYITLTNKDETHGITFDISNFEILAFWTAIKKYAPYVCIEPWNGCADKPNTDHDFRKKRDLVNLTPNEEKSIKYSFRFF